MVTSKLKNDSRCKEDVWQGVQSIVSRVGEDVAKRDAFQSNRVAEIHVVKPFCIQVDS